MVSKVELMCAGWEQRGTLDEPRLSEVATLYAELGFEVRLEPVVPGGDSECDACWSTARQRYRTVYTRPAADGINERHLE